MDGVHAAQRSSWVQECQLCYRCASLLALCLHSDQLLRCAFLPFLPLMLCCRPDQSHRHMFAVLTLRSDADHMGVSSSAHAQQDLCLGLWHCTHSTVLTGGSPL